VAAKVPEHHLEGAPAPLEAVPEHSQRQRRGRLPREEELAVAEGTFLAVAEEEIEHMDCSVNSKQPRLPYPDLPEEPVEEPQTDRYSEVPRVARRKDFRMPEERRVQEERPQRDRPRSAASVPEELRTD